LENLRTENVSIILHSISHVSLLVELFIAYSFRSRHLCFVSFEIMYYSLQMCYYNNI